MGGNVAQLEMVKAGQTFTKEERQMRSTRHNITGSRNLEAGETEDWVMLCRKAPN